MPDPSDPAVPSEHRVFPLYEKVLITLDEITQNLAKPIFAPAAQANPSSALTTQDAQLTISYLDLISKKLNDDTYNMALRLWAQSMHAQKQKSQSGLLLASASGDTSDKKFNMLCSESLNQGSVVDGMAAVAQSTKFKEWSKTNPACMERINRTLVIEELMRFRPETEHLTALIKHDPTADTDYIVFMNKLAQAKFALKAGTHFAYAGGATGSLILKDIYGVPVGIFKSAGEISAAKQWGGQASRLSKETLAQPIGEVLGFWLSSYLQLSLVPRARMTSIPILGKEEAGVFIEFLNPTQYQPLGIKSLPHENSPGSIDDFQKMAIFDFLIGNMDRHDDNLFVNLSKQSYEDVQCIDNANSFPIGGPSFIIKKNMYKWRGKAIAQHGFTEKSKQLIAELSDDKLKPFIRTVRTAYPTYLSSEAEDFFWLRRNLLQEVLKEKIRTPAELGAHQTRSEINSSLHH